MARRSEAKKIYEAAARWRDEEDSGELLDLLKSKLMALRYEHREPPSDEEIEEAKTRVRNSLVSELRSSEDVIGEGHGKEP